MTTSRDPLEYLWDPSSPADPNVERIEAALRPLRFDSARAPLRLAARRRPLRPLIILALAASLLIAAGSGFWMWRLQWPEGRAWRLQSSVASQVEVGRTITLPEGEAAVARVARIGSMRATGGSAFELRATRDTRHRLRLFDGRLHLRVFAPPLSVVIETAAGDVTDLGCEFVLTADDTQSAVTVLSGWVQMENAGGEVLVPAGASSTMRRGDIPTAPVFDDAHDDFRRAARALDEGVADAMSPAREAVRFARPRDVYTLLHLAARHRGVAEMLLRRAAELSPPPGDVTVAGILRGDRDALWTWSDALPLPPPKSWWRNWRDALPLD